MFIVHFHYIRTSDVLKNDKHVQTKNTLDSRVFFKSFMLSSPCTVWLGYHEFQVPKMEVVNLIGGGGPLLTGYIGEDSSILGTWNVWWFFFMQNYGTLFTTTCGNRGTFPIPRKFLVGWFNFSFWDNGESVCIVEEFSNWGIREYKPPNIFDFEKTKMIQFCPDFEMDWNHLYTHFFFETARWTLFTISNGEHRRRRTANTHPKNVSLVQIIFSKVVSTHLWITPLGFYQKIDFFHNWLRGLPKGCVETTLASLRLPAFSVVPCYKETSRHRWYPPWI